MKQFILLLTLLIVGCAGETQVPAPVTEEQPVVPTVDRLQAHWYVSNEFSADEIETILVAGSNWNEVTNGRVQLTFTVTDVDEGTPWVIARTALDNACCAGTTAPTLDHIDIDAEDYKDRGCVGELWHIAVHELGHALGIVVHGGNGIMKYHKPDCNAVFTRSDLELFEAANP